MAPTRRVNRTPNVEGVPPRVNGSVTPRNGNRAAGDLASPSRPSPPIASGSGGLKISEVSTFAANTEWESSSCEFLTAFPTEEKKIIWRIKDFTTMQMLKASEDNHKITFNAGQQIGMPSKWSFTVMCNATDDKIGLFLSLEDYNGSAAKIFARFDSAIKYPCGTKDVVNRTVQPTDLKSVEDWGWSGFVSLSQLKTAGALVNDTVTIDIKFVLYGKETVNVTSSHASNAMLEQESRFAVTDDLKNLLKSGSNADFSIRVKSDDSSDEYVTVKAHKSILCARSAVFEAMIESDMQESLTGIVTLEDLSPKGLTVFMKFLYSGQVDKEWVNIPEEIVNAAEKYSLPKLKNFCDNNLHFTCTTENAFQLLKIAKLHNLFAATKNITEFIKANVDGIMESY